jgi:hypothetical protein
MELFSFLRPSVTLSLLCSNILLSTLFLNTLLSRKWRIKMRTLRCLILFTSTLISLRCHISPNTLFSITCFFSLSEWERDFRTHWTTVTGRLVQKR